MSIENAILELAAAINNLAKANAPQTRFTEVAEKVTERKHGQLVPAADTIEADVTKVETDAKAEQKKVMAQVEADRKPTALTTAVNAVLSADKPSTAKEAVADALARAKAEKDAEANAGLDAADLLDASPLDYEKDVKPKLVQVGKNKQEMVDLLASFGVGKDLTYAKADMLPADKFGAVVAACDKILAARG